MENFDLNFISAITGLGVLIVAFLNHQLQKKVKENKALQETINNVHTQVYYVTQNNYYTQAPEEIKIVLNTVLASTAGTSQITPIPFKKDEGK